MADGPQTQTGAYDRAERERLRRRLLDYMDSQQIGVPSLQQRLASATGRSAQEIPLSTLQRFLAGRHRTNDVFVKICQTFVLGLSAPEGYAAFGEALSGFYRAGEGESVSGAATCARLAGEFRVFRRGNDGEPASGSFAVIAFAAVANAPFCEASESVTDGPDSPHANSLRTRRRDFDGVALARSGGLLVLLRDVVTRADKAYRFDDVSESPDARRLAGHGFDRMFRAGMRESAPVPLDVIAMRAAP